MEGKALRRSEQGDGRGPSPLSRLGDRKKQSQGNEYSYGEGSDAKNKLILQQMERQLAMANKIVNIHDGLKCILDALPKKDCIKVILNDKIDLVNKLRILMEFPRMAESEEGREWLQVLESTDMKWLDNLKTEWDVLREKGKVTELINSEIIEGRV